MTFRKRTFAGGGIYVLLENLPMDKYLYGLAEVPASWPDAAAMVIPASLDIL